MLHNTIRIAAILWIIVCGMRAVGSPFTWDGGGSPNSNVVTAANWVGDVAPDFALVADDITFAGAVNTSPNIRWGTIDGDLVTSRSRPAPELRRCRNRSV